MQVVVGEVIAHTIAASAAAALGLALREVLAHAERRALEA